ncbi:bifunctional glutamate N-acetyltransferase/amino-acid acetyltransferase ArgJ [Candidatus Entotheonella palauensis]|uniref:bifunctional glutamate N-acetyltransferase/amino-acid acetyltransferase ArgJ n=1 Tax=Candidatus Entotheonella palauensis TaxID=93172 RepID=UPI000B7E58BA|nr:bifunctional glutamate N-acetyltransferase/amino-acid acetyltransferase ArgJ [Candidatus Entotheonella palauensis]
MTQAPTLPAYPQGYLSLAKNIGIKDDTLDFTVVYSTARAAAAGVFTQSLFCGAPVIVGREHLADGHLQAVVVNSKNANVATGKQGVDNSREITRLVARELGVAAEDVLPSSTGVIGQQLPIERFRAAMAGLRDQLKPEELGAAAQAIMTTDTRPKARARRVGPAVLAGMAKGSGMIEPNMATMLSFLFTDAAIPPDTLQPMLRQAVDQSFNMVSVDTDTSTSDTVVIMANGLAGEVDLDAFQTALDEMCIELAKEVARDGEGATKLLEVAVTSARDDQQAKRVAKAIVNSPLMKTAVHGADPNWGRVAMAVGKCEEETDIRPENVTMSFGDTCVYAKGEPLGADLAQLESYLEGTEIRILVDLGLHTGQATVWGCDLTEEYVRINALYTT